MARPEPVGEFTWMGIRTKAADLTPVQCMAIIHCHHQLFPKEVIDAANRAHSERERFIELPKLDANRQFIAFLVEGYQAHHQCEFTLTKDADTLLREYLELAGVDRAEGEASVLVRRMHQDTRVLLLQLNNVPYAFDIDTQLYRVETALAAVTERVAALRAVRQAIKDGTWVPDEATRARHAKHVENFLTAALALPT